MPGKETLRERGGERSDRRIADRYEVVEAVASGNMGSVFRVIDHSTGAEVALKRPRLEGDERAFLRESFEREFQVLAGLDHPRITRVYDYGVDAEGPYYTMELVAGTDVKSAAPLPWRDACLCLRDIATSLALLHARRFLHRDLSPSNARITPDGHCKLLDFGALTTFGRPSFVVGTPPVVPPEALQDTPLDQRADLFALGALGYFMLTGRHAYPARALSTLPEMWERAPARPSSLAADVPPDLDALILSMLSINPLARPASAAEVIVRLGVLADLPAEKEGEIERLAQSFLSSPRFIGRDEELGALGSRVAEAHSGRGGAALITSDAGMGRTRLLEELGLRARIAGATVLAVDASIDRQQHGTARALATRLFDALPELARDKARRYQVALSALGRDIVVRLPSSGSIPPGLKGTRAAVGADGAGDVEDWFAEVSRSHPLVLLVDNVESADAASLGVLAGLATMAPELPLLVVATERTEREPSESIGLTRLRAHAVRVPISGFGSDETLELVRSVFGDVPHVRRFAQWLHARTAGCPLHCVEISRQLVARQVIRYVGGTWVLPAERPDAELPSALEDTLAMRLDLLGEQARGLAECLSLAREPPTFRLCRLLVDAADERQVHAVLDDLASNDVLHLDDEQFRFSSAGLRDAVLAAMDGSRLRHNHRRLGEALASFEPDDLALRLEAGWHLIRGGDETRGAEMIAEVTCHVSAIQKMIANMHPAGEPIEAALKVFKSERRSKLERMPLLGALALAGYYEAREWGQRYGDEALDVAEDLTGLHLARRLRPLMGRNLALFVALGVAAVRFYLAPRRERRYSFEQLLTTLFAAVITLTAAATVVLHVERAKRVAEVIEPFSGLPERLVPVGIYRLCAALGKLCEDDPAAASAAAKSLARRFDDRRYFAALDDDHRLLFQMGVMFAIGACAILHEDGTEALEAAEVLEASGLKLYQMIASQLRYLYYTNRGEIAKAAPHREQVDVYAAHVGSAWQVEMWEPAALGPFAAQMGDVIALTRIEERLSVLSRTVPSLERYELILKTARIMVSAQDRLGDERFRSTLETTERELRDYGARSFIGWSATHGLIAGGFNVLGDHARAAEICRSVLEHLTDADYPYTVLFRTVEIEMAVAEAGLGHPDEALARIDALIARAGDIDHPLEQGLLHEARARIALDAGHPEIYMESLAAMERWLLPTGTPVLVTRCKRLAELGGHEAGKGGPAWPAALAASESARDEDHTTDRDDRPPEMVSYGGSVPEGDTVAIRPKTSKGT